MKKSLRILILIISAILSHACIWEELPMGDGAYNEGTSHIEGIVEFRPMNEALTATKSAGDAVKDINDLNIIIYSIKKDNSESLFRCDYIPNFTTIEKPRTGANIAEDSTPSGTINLDLPNGRYKIFTVANIGSDMSSNPQYKENIRNSNDLRHIDCSWNNQASLNNLMFGYFSNTQAIPENNSNAEIITLRADTQLYCWIRRMVSKVTISFDGSALNESVFIYLKSVQIKDIPAHCYLGAANTPSSVSELIKEGETITYSNSTDYSDQHPAWIAKGRPHYPQLSDGHSETASALYFFENLQGTGKDKRQDANGDSNLDAPGKPGDPGYIAKDGKGLGTYIEVKARYVNRSSTNPSEGNITYRFMLGKDILKDYNAERNFHYKLTMKFRNNADDVDWHIDYVPEHPEIQIANPLYISYLNNSYLDVPIIVKGAPDGTMLNVNIDFNPWWTENTENPYWSKTVNPGMYKAINGFLMLNKGTNNLKNENDRYNEFQRYGYNQNDYPINKSQTSVRFWTRGLIMGNSFSGNNIDFGHQRHAKVTLSVKLKGKTYSKQITVIQVRRIENPVGIWRKHDSMKPFTVELKYVEGDTRLKGGQLVDDYNYTPVISNGEWTAKIIIGSSWGGIRTEGSSTLTNIVKGSTGSKIRFEFQPKSTINSDQYRSGIIEIKYHGNSATHYIVFCQGNGEIQMGVGSGATEGNRYMWHTCNYNGWHNGRPTDVENPLLEGPMFVKGNYKEGISPSENTIADFGKDRRGFRTSLGNTKTMWDLQDNYTAGKEPSDFPWHVTDPDPIKQATAVNVMSGGQWEFMNLHTRKLFGIMYGEECTETMSDPIGATCYNSVGQERGVRGIFCIKNEDISAGDMPDSRGCLFLTLGSTGYGHRKWLDQQIAANKDDLPRRWSTLRYAQRTQEMPASTAINVPNYYDLYIRRGALYWMQRNYQGNIAIDLNYHTYLCDLYSTANAVSLWNGDNRWYSDAMFIRRMNYRR